MQSVQISSNTQYLILQRQRVTKQLILKEKKKLKFVWEALLSATENFLQNPCHTHTEITHIEYSATRHVARLEAFLAAEGLIRTSTWTYQG